VSNQWKQGNPTTQDVDCGEDSAMVLPFNKRKLLRMLESETKRENAGKSQQVWQHM